MNPNYTKHIHAIIALIFLIFLQGLCTNAFAQGEGSKIDSVDMEIPEAFELIELGEKLKEANNDYGRISSRIESGIKILSLDTSLTEFIEKLNMERELYERFKEVSPNRQKLDNMIKRWRSFEERLNQWHSSINAHQNRSKSDKEDIDFKLKSWELTKINAVDQNAPDIVLSDINTTVTKLDSFIAILTEQDNKILELESKLVARKIETDNIATDLEDWSQSGELNIFYLRHEPIWNTRFDSHGYAENRDLGDKWKDRIIEIREYFKSYGHRLNLYLLFVMTFLGFVFFLRHNPRNKLSENLSKLPIDHYNLLFKRPLALGILLALLLAFFFFENIPEVIGELGVILLLTLTATLFKDRLTGKFRLLFPVIILAFITSFIKSYFWFSSSDYRLYMYFESFFTLAFIIYFINPRDLNTGRSLDPVEKSLLNVAYVLIFFQIVAILSNTLGYTNLTDLALKLSIYSAIIGCIAFALRIALNSIFSVIVMRFYPVDNVEFSLVVDFLKKIDGYIRVFAWFFWVGFLLVATDLHILLRNSLGPWLRDPVIIGDYSITPASILSFIGVMIAAYFLTRFISALLDRDLVKIFHVAKGWPGTLSMILRYLIIGFAIFISLGVLGIDVKNFTLVAGALGLGIGFGLKDIVSNFIAGIILAFEQPIKSGDVIEVGSVMGFVGKIGIRSSKVRSYDGADISVPNNILLSKELINWTHQDLKRRLDLRISTEYGSDPNKVLEILRSIAENYPKTIQEPSPMALLEKFGESALDFRLLFWVPVDSGLSATSDVYLEIYNRLKEEGIDIPYPRRDINILNDRSQ